MPIKPENRALYPPDWSQIRERIRVRAGNRCERCGVKNYALGGREAGGLWFDAEPLGDCVRGLIWPKPGGMAWCRRGNIVSCLRIIRIVCTVAHVHDPDPASCSDNNLAFWCQRCHNLHDMPMRQAHAYETRRAGRAVADLFASEVANGSP